MTSEFIHLPDESLAPHKHVLRQEIPALQLVATENGHARWGPLIRLPRGAELDEFGRGFDDHTLLVRFGASFYVVFHDDLAASKKSLKLRGRPHKG